jgi:hypothetical protein
VLHRHDGREGPSTDRFRSLLLRGEHPIDHAAVEVHIRIQCAAEALHKAHRAQPPAHAAAALTQPRFDHPQKGVQHRTERLGIAASRK